MEERNTGKGRFGKGREEKGEETLTREVRKGK